jgi:hypothetical protein
VLESAMQRPRALAQIEAKAWLFCLRWLCSHSFDQIVELRRIYDLELDSQPGPQ